MSPTGAGRETQRVLFRCCLAGLKIGSAHFLNSLHRATERRNPCSSCHTPLTPSHSVPLYIHSKTTHPLSLNAVEKVQCRRAPLFAASAPPPKNCPPSLHLPPRHLVGLNPHDVEWLPGDGPPPTAAHKPPATAEPSHHNTSARMAPPHAQHQPRCARPSGGAVIGAAGAAYYDQQPELLESLMYLYRVTGNVTYREWGWSIFRATQLWTR